MGEEVKQEEVKLETKAEEKPAEEKKEESTPPSPVVLFVDLHCVGCSKKIERTLMKVRGVEAVAFNMALNQVTVKGVVDPQSLCTILQKKTKRRASILSPLPAAEGEPTPQLVTSQVSGLITVELNVDMHCEACAQKIKKSILKMRGVQTAETDLASGKVTVTGTMDPQRLVEYVYRRTKKQARIVPQPEQEPEPKPEPKKEEEKKEEGGEKPAQEAAEKGEENKEKKEEEKPGEQAQEEKKENVNNDENNKSESENKEGESKGDEKVEEGKEDEVPKQLEDDQISHEEKIAKMMHYYQPLYVIERIPPPQLFSDENPNACCIT